MSPTQPPKPPEQPHPQPTPQPHPPEQPKPSSHPASVGGAVPTQRQLDNEKRARGSGNWLKAEGDVVGEKPASIDFVGSYDWPNVCEPGENRDDDTPVTPSSDREYELQKLEMEDKLAADERGRQLARQAKAREKFKQQLADGTAAPPFSHSLIEEDSQMHPANKPTSPPPNRPAA